MLQDNDELYVGYLDRSPPGIAAWSRRVVLVVLALVFGVGLLLVFGQARFDFGVFEFGVETSFEGVVVERPYPMLLVPDQADPQGAISVHYLVASGKHGAERLVKGMDSEPARITGSLIYNDSATMIEVHAVERLGSEAAGILGRPWNDREQSLGTMTLVGEIVDAKCYLGVMKPGRGKVHKACAIRCISGGAPPVLRVEDREGNIEHFMLVSADGQAVHREVLDMVAEPVEITGEVARFADLLILYANPETFRRVDSREYSPRGKD